MKVPPYTKNPLPAPGAGGGPEDGSESAAGSDGNIPVIALHLGQDDPKKCSARKMARFGLATIEEKPERIKRGILLDPFATKALSPADAGIARHAGLVVLDCSWRGAEKVFPDLRLKTRSRALPYLMACNPVNFGHPFKLSSLEAVGASLYIMGAKAQAERLMRLYKWSHHFLDINREPLDEYAACSNSAGVVKAQALFYEADDDESGSE